MKTTILTLIKDNLPSDLQFLCVSTSYMLNQEVEIKPLVQTICVQLNSRLLGINAHHVTQVNDAIVFRYVDFSQMFETEKGLIHVSQVKSFNTVLALWSLVG